MDGSLQPDAMAKTRHRSIEADPRWRAVLARDPRADGRFVYAVRTTGVYCHPSSPSRLPRPQNVEFFDTPAAAEAAGYRASRHPASQPQRIAARHAQMIAQACRAITTAETAPSLQQLADAAAMSPFHFHRIFKTQTGLTPKAYGDAHRASRVRARMATSDTVTRAIYDAGFQSNSRFYASAAQTLGMKPGAYRAGGSRTDIYFAVAQCSLGALLVAQSGVGVCAILMGDDPEALLHDLQDRFPRANLIGADAAFERQVASIVGFIEAPEIGLALPLDIRGTAFQLRVWQALREIPAGATVSYAQVAARIGSPGAVRAVARACAANALAVAIPCHRVVRSDGKLSGYRWGIERKRELLSREAAAIPIDSPDAAGPPSNGLRDRARVPATD